MIQKIEITFPMPVELSNDFKNKLMNLVDDVCREYEKKNPTGTVQDFYRQKDGEFKTLFKEYDDHMTALYSHYFGSGKPAANAPPASASPQPAPAAKAPAPAAKALPRVEGPLEKRLRESKKAGS